ncbi:MAG TPA: ABC transporter permease [Steroidobacteraceae bacterium]|jgi:putative ABC transport system permease protein|nr:ABC transporter permease [Steroidobacteraceae bacterium]
MMPIRHCLTLALGALKRNRLQTTLAIIGMGVGVGALVTSVALGRGAQQAISDQLRAAGANVIVVTAGNYLQGVGNVGTHESGAGDGVPTGAKSGEDSTDHNGALLPPQLQLNRPPTQSWEGVLPTSYNDSRGAAPLARRLGLARDGDGDLIAVHEEDDPFAVHDHPTAAQRLGDSMAGLGAAATLTRKDADAIRAMDGVQYVASSIQEDQRLKVQGQEDNSWFTYMRGTDDTLPMIRTGWVFPYGAFFTPDDVKEARQVMVLGRVASDHLFGHDINPMGRTVMLWNQNFKVIGLVSSRSWATQPTPGDHEFDAFYLPVTTVQRLLDLGKLNTITVTTKSVGDTSLISRRIVDLLRTRHKINERMADDFTVRTQAQLAIGHGLPPTLARVLGGNMEDVDKVTIGRIADSLKRANNTMISLLAGVAAVSLLVGGIGIMNILLLSVTERTREIGLRMALGARRSDVITQFVAEAVLLSVIGGLLGTAVGALASGSLEKFFQYSIDISILSSLVAIAVAAILGIIFGVYPARRAAGLDPIEALHHE